MAITNTQYEKICRFLDAGMDMEEMEAFEAELMTHPEMRQQLDFELLVRDGLVLGNASGQKKGLVEAETTATATMVLQENARFPLKPSFKIWFATGVAAALLLAVSLVILFTQPAKKNTAVAEISVKDSGAVKNPITHVIAESPSIDSSKRIDGPALFAKYYSKDKIPDNYPIYLADALTRYEAGDYTSLRQLSLAAIPETRGSDEAASKEKIWQLASYYKALAFLETGETAKAISYFNELIKHNPGSELRARANWYLALAYLKEDAPEKAKPPLNYTISNDHNQVFSKKAKALSAILQ